MLKRECLPFDDFRIQLAEIIHLDSDRLTADTNLVLDLGLDSLKLLEIMLELDKMGIQVNIKEAWGIQTVGEAYEYYQRELSNGGQDI